MADSIGADIPLTSPVALAAILEFYVGEMLIIKSVLPYELKKNDIDTFFNMATTAGWIG